ncbi:hypothetical protein SDC9_178611 [bioreactor metagenome]|uniref:Uncharacterized protein n=1 Tax=bioreactor metagenome TaxID=1076179 RepID=A0A645GWQ7_9ZZZZ
MRGFARIDEFCDHLAAIVFILDCGRGARLRKAVERIRIERILYAIERFKQRRVAHGVTHAKAGQRMRLRERFDNEQIVVFAYQRHTALCAELHVRFVDDHGAVGIMLEYIAYHVAADGQGRRRVRIANDNAAGA